LVGPFHRYGRFMWCVWVMQLVPRFRVAVRVA
jgi:hypothetical protein